MIKPINSIQDLGLIVREVRKAQGIRQDELAAMVPASHVFIIDVERGKPSAQVGKVFALLRELGIRLSVDIPEATAATKKQRTKRTASQRNG